MKIDSTANQHRNSSAAKPDARDITLHDRQQSVRALETYRPVCTCVLVRQRSGFRNTGMRGAQQLLAREKSPRRDADEGDDDGGKQASRSQTKRARKITAEAKKLAAATEADDFLREQAATGALNSLKPLHSGGGNGVPAGRSFGQTVTWWRRRDGTLLLVLATGE